MLMHRDDIRAPSLLPRSTIERPRLTRAVLHVLALHPLVTLPARAALVIRANLHLVPVGLPERAEVNTLFMARETHTHKHKREHK